MNNRTKLILWKSDLWPFTAFFGLITLFLAVFGIIHFVENKQGEAFACALAALIPLILTIVCATNDSESLRRATAPEIIEKAKDAAWEDSFLNPKNIPSGKKDPPDIG